MDPAGDRIDLLRQRVGIGRFQLLQLPPVQHPLRQRHPLIREALRQIMGLNYLSSSAPVSLQFEMIPAAQ